VTSGWEGFPWAALSETPVALWSRNSLMLSRLLAQILAREDLHIGG
jgi:hypothetical protein